MNLPEDKQERQKIFILMGIGAVVVCYVGYMFGMLPVIKKHNETIAATEKLEQNLARADRTIKMVPKYFKQNGDIISRILDISENKLQVLHPNLGNYLLVAGEIVNRHADELNITIESITEVAVPKKAVRKNKKDENPDEARFTPYIVNISIECSFSDLQKLIKAIEDENPYSSITRLSIIGQPDNVLKHLINFNLQWPTWIDNKQPIKLTAQQMIAKSRE